MTETLLILLAFICGLGAGAFLYYWYSKNLSTNQLNLKEQLKSEMKETFSALSLEALSKSTSEFLKVAETKLSQQTESGKQHLDGKKQLIDQTLSSMKTELTKVQDMVQSIEKERKAKFDVLNEQITQAASETRRLRESTNTLNEALTNSRVRGQWGDRMAEDILRLAGFIEGVNYQKQATLAIGESAGNRPDYTFKLPGNRVVHMDVKFPLDNYLNYLSAESAHDKEMAKKSFLKDVKARIKEASTRGYIGEAGETLDYVLVFIPNEQVYAFLHEQDQSILDDALSKKVILCSPMTLYAVLAVIRQAVDNFKLEQTAGQILSLLAEFHGQWDKFSGSMAKLGDRIYATQKEFDVLTSTRANMLEKPLRKIEMIRQQQTDSTGIKSSTDIKQISTPLEAIESQEKTYS